MFFSYYNLLNSIFVALNSIVGGHRGHLLIKHLNYEKSVTIFVILSHSCKCKMFKILIMCTS